MEGIDIETYEHDGIIDLDMDTIGRQLLQAGYG